MDDGTIIVTKLERGMDIPGGHVEDSDVDITATAVREAREEAGIDLAEPLYLLGVIESDYDEYPTYMLVATTRVSKLNTYTPQFESLGRERVTIENFLKEYTAGSEAMMRELCKRAEVISGNFLKRAK